MLLVVSIVSGYVILICSSCIVCNRYLSRVVKVRTRKTVLGAGYILEGRSFRCKIIFAISSKV